MLELYVKEKFMARAERRQAAFENVAQQAEQGCRFPMRCATTSRFALELTWKASDLRGAKEYAKLRA
jgi:hypothetical protein